MTRLLALLSAILIAASPLPAPRPAPHVIPAEFAAWPSGNLEEQAGAPAGDGTPSPAAVATVAPSSSSTGTRLAGNEAAAGRNPPADLHGRASWFDARPGTAAAGPALRKALGPHWRGTVVIVTANGHSVRVRLLDWCFCMRHQPGERLIDLSRSAFSRLADPSLGLVRVTVRRG